MYVSILSVYRARPGKVIMRYNGGRGMMLVTMLLHYVIKSVLQIIILGHNLKVNKEFLIFLGEIAVVLLGVLLFIALRSCGHEWLGIRLCLTVFMGVMWTDWILCVRSGHFRGIYKTESPGQFALRKYVMLLADIIASSVLVYVWCH